MNNNIIFLSIQSLRVILSCVSNPAVVRAVVDSVRATKGGTCDAHVLLSSAKLNYSRVQKKSLRIWREI